MAEPATSLSVPVRADAVSKEAVWARVQMARNVKRPHTLELIELMSSEYVELHGDRLFRDDPAIAGGLARIDGRDVVFVGHQKGSETDENVRRNFGMPHPEGYRKAIRLFQLAERFRLPVVTFIDTPGAFPGPASEERGVAEAIAQSITTLSSLRTPVVAAITGEGGSGGALALGVADVVLALENAIYSVISPEGCASILWRTPDAAQDAAVAMRITAPEQAELGVIDEVVEEPEGGAHEDPGGTASRLQAVLLDHFDALTRRDPDELVAARYARFREMGAFVTVERPPSERPERKTLSDRIRELLGAGFETMAGRDRASLRPQAADTDEEL